MPFVFRPLAIPDVVLIEPRLFPDARGFFLETFKASEFAAHGIDRPFVQDNHSRSTRGVLRGLHYQKQAAAQGKLVRVIGGAIFDVAVDIRRGSPTYGRWVAETLSEENHFLLYVPPGFAHGFCTLSDTAEVAYKATAEYAPEVDRGIVWNDPDLAVAWPIREPVLSAKDAALPRLREADNDFLFAAAAVGGGRRS